MRVFSVLVFFVLVHTDDRCDASILSSSGQSTFGLLRRVSISHGGDAVNETTNDVGISEHTQPQFEQNRLRGNTEMPSEVASPSVDLHCGHIEGTWLLNETIAAFRGVRYALAPIGAQRFQPPRPAGCKDWTGGRLLAKQSGPACLQLDDTDDNAPAVQDEDCLSLNIYLPAASLPLTQPLVRTGASGIGANMEKSLLPVVVWIHGGNLAYGSIESGGRLETMVAAAAKDNRPFLLVAMNYRLHALGFAALPELAIADSRGVAGNYGILDQIEALKWVHGNVQSFGGDPHRVTLLGQSSGGTSIFALMSAPSARGLFHRAISLSGSPNVAMSRAEKEKQDQEQWLPHTPCADHTGSKLAECLRAADPRALAKALPSSYSAWGFDGGDKLDYEAYLGAHSKGIGWSALLYVDGVTISRPVIDAMSAGLPGNVSLLLWNMQCEFGDEEHVPSFADLKLKLTSRSSATEAGKLLQYYETIAADHTMLGNPNWERYAVSSFVADVSLTCGTLALAQAASRSGSIRAFVGTVVQGPSLRSALSDQCAGKLLPVPSHSADLQALFAMLESEQAGNISDVSQVSPSFNRWDPLNRLGDGDCPYQPTIEYLSLVQELWRHVLSFVITGKPLDSWQEMTSEMPVSDKEDDKYAHAVLGFPPGRTSTVHGWKSRVCRELRDELQLDSRYWIMN